MKSQKGTGYWQVHLHKINPQIPVVCEHLKVFLGQNIWRFLKIKLDATILSKLEFPVVGDHLEVTQDKVYNKDKNVFI